jgi:acyl-CoA hydrolase
MNLQEQINQAETRIFKTVFPNTTNHYDTLLEEQLFYDGRSSFLLPLDLLEKDVTVSSDKIDFTKPIPAGTIIELIGVTRGNTSRRES